MLNFRELYPVRDMSSVEERSPTTRACRRHATLNSVVASLTGCRDVTALSISTELTSLTGCKHCEIQSSLNEFIINCLFFMPKYVMYNDTNGHNTL